MKKRTPINKRITLYVSLLTVVTLLLSSTVEIIFSHQIVNDKSDAKVINELEHQASVLDGWVEKQQAIITDVANFCKSLTHELPQARQLSNPPQLPKNSPVRLICLRLLLTSLN